MSREKIRQQLLDELSVLTARQAVIQAHLRNTDRSVPDDWSDRVTFTENDEVLEALDDHGRSRLALLQAAIAHLDDSSWGRCVTCEADIDPRRLEALPTAEQCIDCASLA